jgi:hypothetical protein
MRPESSLHDLRGNLTSREIGQRLRLPVGPISIDRVSSEGNARCWLVTSYSSLTILLR